MFHIIQLVVVYQKNGRPGPGPCAGRPAVVLEQHPAVAVHDALGLPGGARGEQHPQRRVERHPLEPQLAGVAVASCHGTPTAVGDQARRAGPDGARGRWPAAWAAPAPARPARPAGRPPGRSTRSRRRRRGPPARVGRSARRHPPPSSPARRRPRPRRCWRCRGRPPAWGGVGQVTDDPVAGPDPRRPQPAGEGSHLRAQLGPRRRGRRAVLVDRGDRHGVRPARVGAGAQGVLGVVEAAPREPPGAWHAGLGQDGVRGAVGGDVEEVPDGRPEVLQVLDRPGPEVAIGTERAPGPGAHLGGEPGDRRIRDGVGIRGPDGLGRVAVRHLAGQERSRSWRRPLDSSLLGGHEVDPGAREDSSNQGFPQSCG